MAKATTLSADAARVNNPAPSAPDAPAVNAATPDNTPIPGGGRWHWDYDYACWAETASGTDTPAPLHFPTLE